MPLDFALPRSLRHRSQKNTGPATYGQVILRDSPLVYWPFSEASGSTAADLSGNGATGAYGAGVTLGQAGATSDGATAVKGSGSAPIASYTPGAALLSGNAPFSLECFFKTAAGTLASGNPTLGSVGAAVQYELFQWVCLNSNTVFAYSFFNNNVNITTPTWDDSIWRHLVLTWDPVAKGAVYVNGTALQTGINPASPPALGSGPLVAGNCNGTAQYWKGWLQHFALYGTCLSAARVAAHYAAR